MDEEDSNEKLYQDLLDWANYNLTVIESLRRRYWKINGDSLVMHSETRHVERALERVCSSARNMLAIYVRGTPWKS